MSKIHTLSALAVASILSIGTASAQPAIHVVHIALHQGTGHVMQIDLKATDDEANPVWDTPNYTPAQVAAAARNGNTDLNATDQETNPGPGPGLLSQQLAIGPGNNGGTDLNPYDNAA